MILVLGTFWSTFPYASVGAAVGVIGVIVMALRLAVTWGSILEQVADHGREIAELRSKADGVPTEVNHEVTNRNKFIEGSMRALTRKLRQLYKAARQLKRQFDQIRERCAKVHGPLDELPQDEIDNVLATPPDTEEGGSDEATG